MTLRTFCAFARHKKSILSIGIRNAFTGSGLSLVAVRNWPWERLCGSMGGIRNPFDKSRYWYGRAFAPLWFNWRMDAINKADRVLIRADEREIDEYIVKTKGRNDKDCVVHFPTRADTDIFKPAPIDTTRKQFLWDKDELIIVTTGRISWVKGWDLILDTFRHLLIKRSSSRLVYVGDGEDSPMLRRKIIEYGLSDNVYITGFVQPTLVADYLNAANVFVMASHWEGWPTSMVEALACGKPVVYSDIRAAPTLVVEGQNGYVIKNRDPVAFAEAIERAAGLKSAAEVSLQLSERYALKHLTRDIGRLWPVLAD